MPRGPSPARALLVASSHGHQCMEQDLEIEQELEEAETDDVGATDSAAESMSVASWDTDSESEKSTEASDATFEDEACVNGGRSKRRRLDGDESRRRKDAAEATLIILDWDDTLLPSTWLQQHGLGITASSPAPSEEQKVVLRRLAGCVIRTLRRAKRLGHVTIVTNAEKGWVELSSAKFLPEVVPLLEGIRVCSARSTFPHTEPESTPVHWKCHAFHKEVTAFFQRPLSCAAAGYQKHIVSIGDSMQERAALHGATEDKECWSKSLKLLERPSPEQLVKQHELLTSCLRPFVDYSGSLDLCLQVPS